MTKISKALLVLLGNAMQSRVSQDVVVADLHRDVVGDVRWNAMSNSAYHRTYLSRNDCWHEWLGLKHCSNFLKVLEVRLC